LLISPLSLVAWRLYEGENHRGKALILSIAAVATEYTRFESLGLSPIALDLGLIQIRWYSLAYLVGILLGYWYMLRLIAQPGAPMARRHADDLMLYATLGIILGGRLGYVFFYKPELLEDPINVVKVWEGGMSFHGGLLGVIAAMGLLAWRNRLNFLRVADYIACCVPFGLFFGRLANVVNGELWGRPTDVPWAIIFPGDPEQLPRHPSQLYEAGLEGLVMMAVLSYLFWRTGARHRPGLIAGVFLTGYGLSRFALEFVRNPDAHLIEFAQRTGLSMGQWLTLPMLLVGLFLILTARGRTAQPVAA